MGIISYAQNFEDVLLWRALGHIQNGCYIDIGAHDPVVDSVSKAFYEHGWRGIHLEPLPVYCNALRQDRPDETVLQAAVAAENGVLRFYEIPETGISTGDEAIARSHRERGFPINEITVPCVTLAQVFELVQSDVVHWLKIDVEGLEEEVLRGWGESALRPWIVVVESTLPLTQDEVFSTWEGLLTEKGYRCVHFDGLNRYYLSAEQPDLDAAFRCGPNVFDGFELYGTASNTFTKHVAESVRNELVNQIEALKQQATQHQAGDHGDATRLVEALQCSENLKQALQAEQTANLQNQNAAKALALQFAQQARQDSEAQLRQAIQREQEFTAQLLASKEQLQHLEQAHGARESQLREQLAQVEQQFRQESEAQLRQAMQREQEFIAQLLASQEKLRQLEQAQGARESQLREQLTKAEQQFRQESEAQLRQATQREQEFTTQLLASQEQLQQLAQAHGARESQLREQLAQAEQQFRQESEAQLRSAMQREQEFTAQLLAGKDQLQQLANEHAVRESSLREQVVETTRQFRLESEAHLRSAVEREQAIAAQLLVLQQQAAQALSQQARELQLQHEERRLAWEAQENALRQEVSNLANEVQALRHANELQTQQHGFVMDAHLVEHQRLIEAYAALESRLKAEIASEQQTSMHLRQTLADVQQALADTYASLSWRLTAPLRAVFFFFAPKQSGCSTITAVPPVIQQPVSPSSSLNIQGPSPEPIMPPTSATLSNMSTTVASTLDVLLAYHDQSFVVSAYHTLLGRGPDPEGLGYYLGRLRTGIPKIQLLAQLRRSKEGQAHDAKLVGLDAAIRRHRRGQYPLVGGLFRWLNGGEGNHPTERKLRGIENQLFLLSNESNRRFDQLETALAGLHHLVVQQTQSIVTALGGASVDATESASINSVQAPMPDRLKHLSPSAREIYFQLKTAAARHAVRAA